SSASQKKQGCLNGVAARRSVRVAQVLPECLHIIAPFLPPRSSRPSRNLFRPPLSSLSGRWHMCPQVYLPGIVLDRDFHLAIRAFDLSFHLPIRDLQRFEIG